MNSSACILWFEALNLPNLNNFFSHLNLYFECPSKISTYAGFDNWRTSCTYERLLLLAYAWFWAWGRSKSTFVESRGRGWEEGGGSGKSKQKQTWEGDPGICVRFSKWSFIVILQFFLLIIMAIWSTIMKDYKIRSCQWMACVRFRQPFLLCTTFPSFLCTVYYFLCAFPAKMATYWLVIDVYFVISSYVYWCSEPCLKTLE